MCLFYHRDFENFNLRNSPVSLVHNFTEILPPTSQEMSNADYYLQTHINQFYRIIFFFNDLNMCGEDDDNKDGLVISGELLRILYDDKVYRDYLPLLRSYLKSIKISNVESFLTGDEEDLIYMLSLPNVEHTTFTSSTTTSSSTTLSFTSTTSMYKLSKRKGSICKNKYGKNVRKPSTMTFCEQQ